MSPRAAAGVYVTVAVNTIAEFRHAPPAIAARTARYRAELRDGLRAALRRAAHAGEISPDTVDMRVETFLSVVVAFNLLVSAGAPVRETRRLLAAARAVTAADRARGLSK